MLNSYKIGILNELQYVFYIQHFLLLLAMLDITTCPWTQDAQGHTAPPADQASSSCGVSAGCPSPEVDNTAMLCRISPYCGQNIHTGAKLLNSGNII